MAPGKWDWLGPRAGRCSALRSAGKRAAHLCIEAPSSLVLIRLRAWMDDSRKSGCGIVYTWCPLGRYGRHSPWWGGPLPESEARRSRAKEELARRGEEAMSARGHASVR